MIDHGRGIPQAELERIFEPFQRVDGRAHRRRRARARDRAGLRRGERRPDLGGVAAGPGRDVRARAARRRSRRRWSRHERRARARRRRRAADPAGAADEPARRRLRGRDGDDGRGGPGAAALRPPDAIILDLVLPDGTGIDVCVELRSWSDGAGDRASPRSARSAEKIAALDAGADDYVTKPVGIDELLARLRAALRRAGAAGVAGDRDRRSRRRPREARRLASPGGAST